MNSTTILIADDHAIMRMGLISVIELRKSFKIIGEAEDGEDAVRKVRQLSPDIVIMDLMMPIVDGATATEQIHRSNPETKVLILTTYGTANGIAKALNNGAAGAVLKNIDNNELLDIIERIANGERVISPEIAQYLTNPSPIPDLTDRQKKILDFIIEGRTTKEIADQMRIRTDSVQEHIKSILIKIGASNRTEAVAIALRKHLLKI